MNALRLSFLVFLPAALSAQDRPLSYEYFPGERFTMVLETTLKIDRTDAEGAVSATTVEERATWTILLSVIESGIEGQTVDIRMSELDHRVWSGFGDERILVRYQSGSANRGMVSVYRHPAGQEPEPMEGQSASSPPQRRLVGRRWRCRLDKQGHLVNVRETDVVDDPQEPDPAADALFRALWAELPKQALRIGQAPATVDETYRIPLLGMQKIKTQYNLRDAQREAEYPAVDVEWTAAADRRELPVGLDLTIRGLRSKPEEIRAKKEKLRAVMLSLKGSGRTRLLAASAESWSLQQADSKFVGRVRISLGDESTFRTVRYGRQLRIEY